jgi:hypothetical protein
MDLAFKYGNTILSLMKSISDIHICLVNLGKVISKSVVGIFKVSDFINMSVDSNSGVIKLNSGRFNWVLRAAFS